MRKRQKIKNESYIRKYSLKDIHKQENSWDGGISISGTLCYKNIEVIKFIEHPIEGGFYANGEPLNEKLYCRFLSEFAGKKIRNFNYEAKLRSKKKHDKKAYFGFCEVMNAFDRGIASLCNTDPTLY